MAIAVVVIVVIKRLIKHFLCSKPLHAFTPALYIDGVRFTTILQRSKLRPEQAKGSLEGIAGEVGKPGFIPA